MKFDKRIWKTAVLAAGITLVAGLVVMRLDDWSKGLTSGFIVYGQTGTGGGGGGTTNPCGSSGTSGGSGTSTSTTCITKVLPHVIGGPTGFQGQGYSSVIEIINTSTSTQSIGATFFNDDGTPSTATYNVALNGTASTFTGAMSAPASVPANSIMVLSLPGSGKSFTANWGEITSTGTVTVVEVFELRDGQANLMSRVGVPASPSDLTSFVVPRFRTQKTGLDVGIALANTGAATTITATLRDASGKVLATTTFPLGKNAQIAKFPGIGDSPIFSNLATGDADGYQSITFSAPGPQLAAIGLAIEGGSLATFPVDRIQ